METAPLDHELLRGVLETAGLRCTTQRLAVYDHLSQTAHHPTAEDVYQAVRTRIPRIGLGTVYKALDALVAVGVVTKLTAGIGNASARYDARRDVHYHFRCLRTGTIHDLPTRFDPDLIAKLDPGLSDYLRGQGFRVTGYRLELVGYRDGSTSGESQRDACQPGGADVSQATPLSTRPQGSALS